MATYFDLLDAIARVRAATGNPQAWQAGLSGADIAAACNPVSSPSDLGAVLSKVIAAHPEVFGGGSSGTLPPVAPGAADGATADAIREAETSLAQQNSAAAQVDLHVVTAVLNAHGVHADGSAELERLQDEIENAVLTRTDLDTPSGAREFQRYLIGKLRDIHQVVDTAGLDATSKAELAAALAALYAASAAEVLPSDPAGHSTQQAVEPRGAEDTQQKPRATTGKEAPRPQPTWDGGLGADLGPDPLIPYDFPGMPVGDPLGMSPAAFAPAPASTPAFGPAAAPVPATAPSPVSMAPFTPAWAGGAPAAIGPQPMPKLPGLADLFPPDLESDHLTETSARDHTPEPPDEAPEDPAGQGDPEGGSGEQQGEVEAAGVELPTGEAVTAPTPELAAVITAAVAGTPIPDAFHQQGITIPAPGTPVTAPVPAAQLVPGDIGLLADRHALALGNGHAVLDGRIQPISHVTGPGFLGWQHPPGPGSTATPGVPAPNPTAATAPS